MDDLGVRVRRLRLQMGLKPAQMARTALGTEAEPPDIEYYVQQLSKLERGEEGHTNPGLPRLYTLARGFGFLSLAELFAGLEGVPALFNQHSTKDLQQPVVKHDNPPSPQQGQDYGHFISELEPTLGGIVASGADRIVAAIDRLNTTLYTVLERVDAGPRQTPKADAPSAHSRARHSGRARKSG